MPYSPEYEEEEFVVPESRTGIQETKKEFEEEEENIEIKIELEEEEEPFETEKITSTEIDYSTFKINLDPLDMYYQFLSEKTYRLQETMESKGEVLENNAANTSLCIESISHPKNIVLLLHYQLNCSYSYLRECSQQNELLKLFIPSVIENEIIEQFRLNFNINHLKFNKIGMIEARDFVYLEYLNGLNEQHWEISASVTPENLPEEKKFKRCDLFSIRHLRENNNILYVTQHISLNLNCNSSAVLPILIGEMKTYLNNLEDYLQRNFKKNSSLEA